ncbi:MAG: flagellin [Pseudomonadota bacterium]
MTSLLTNTAAMVALQTLNSINMDLNKTNNAVSTGLRIAEASDSAAYWSIATTTSSDNGAMATVRDALSIGRSVFDVMYNGLDAAREGLQSMKELLVSARQPGVDRMNVQAEINGVITDMVNKANASVINEQNYLAIADHDTENMTKSVLASFERAAGGAVSVSTIELDINGLFLTDGEATVADREGILDQARAGITATATNGGIRALITDGATDPIGDLTDSAADLTTLEGFITAVDAALTETITAQNNVGVTLARSESQLTFISALMDANDRAVGGLVDANMEEESTKLRALQTQQQLAVQSLSIANGAAANVLTLFR